MKISVKNNGINSKISFLISLFIHLFVAALVLFMMNNYPKKLKINPQFIRAELDTINRNFNKHILNSPSLKETKSSEEKFIDKLTKEKKIIDENNVPQNLFGKFNVDTTNLDQLYTEPSLNVTIKYPKGWVYLDQDIKHKLDGVTFWTSEGIYNPPPYIHLDVKDKSLFSANRYKYKIEMNGYNFYYNDPEEMENQVMQTIYIRTNSDVDFSFKLIMMGKSQFDSFQPIFFGMVKSFRFGHSIF